MSTCSKLFWFATKNLRYLERRCTTQGMIFIVRFNFLDPKLFQFYYNDGTEIRNKRRTCSKNERWYRNRVQQRRRFFFYDLLMTILYSYYRNRTAGHLFKNVIKNMISTKASPSCGGTRNEIKLNLISMYIAYYLNEFFGLYIIANAYIKIFLYRYRLVLKQIIR